MKTIRWLVVFSVFALLLSLAAIGVSAAGTGPVGAPYVDNGTHVLAADSTVWYRFEYPGNHSQIMIKLLDAKDKGLGFQVYPPTMMSDWWKHDGIGAGSLNGSDLLWTGNSHEPGAWYVQVTNPNPAPTAYALQVTGKDVSFGQNAPVVAPIQAQAAPALANQDPNNAVIVDSAARLIPGNTTLWYRFQNPGTPTQQILTVPDGAKNNLRVHIHTPEQMKSWWNVEPIGQATKHGDDLIWSGIAPESGWWFVEVINDNPTTEPLQLLLQSSNRR